MLLRLRKLDWGLLIALLLPLIAALPTWGDGIPAGADVEVHVHRIHAITLSLQEGNFYPRWISYFHVGYGYPIFNFYAPGSAYITALFELIGLHITTAYQLVMLLAWSFGSAGMYWLARRFLPMPAAVLAAALWVFAPSRIYEVWWQGSLAQIVAASFIPYLLLAVVNNCEKPSPRRMVWIALPYAALILTHTPMMYIATLYAAPLTLIAPIGFVGMKRWEVLRRWLLTGLGFALGIGLAAIFLLPVLLELQYVTIAGGIDETVTYLQQQFLPLREVFAWPRWIDSTDLYLDLPRTLGLAGGVLSLFGIAALIRRKQWGVLVLSVAGLAFTVFMLLDVSFPLWLSIPGFANLRFPARLLRVGAVLIGLLGGASLLLLPQRYRLWGMIGGLLLVIAQVIPITQPYQVWLNWDNISAYDEILHERDDRTWGTVSYNEFNPRWGERIFLDVPTGAERYIDEPFHIRVFGRDIAALNWQGLSEEWLAPNVLRVTTDEARAVRFRQYYFPGWQVTVNSEDAEIYPDDELGLITVDLPKGEHIVELNYAGTPVQTIATLISGISLLLAIGMLRLHPEEAKSGTTGDERLSPAAGITIIGGVVVLALVNGFVIQPNGWLKFESPPTEPRAMENTVDATFGDQVTLLGYTLREARIAPDAPLEIDLFWHVSESINDNYRPVVQVINLTQTGAYATSSRLLPAAGGFSTYAPERFARDPYTLRLIEDDAAPYVGQISVQLIGEDGALTLPDGSDRLLLEPIIVIDTAGNDVQLQAPYPYQVGEIARLQCAEIRNDGEQFMIDLYWRFTRETDRDLAVMVHGLDDDGAMVVNGDGAPFGGDYPSWAWREEQRMKETRTLAADAEVTQIAIGLYDRNTLERLPVTQGGNPVTDNRILLDVTDTTSCSR